MKNQKNKTTTKTKQAITKTTKTPKEIQKHTHIHTERKKETHSIFPKDFPCVFNLFLYQKCLCTIHVCY